MYEKEQNGLLESQIKDLQITKSDETLDRYDMNKITKFIEEKFSDLPTTLLNSKISQLRVLLCSIFPGGLLLGANGYSHTDMSPFFQSILDLQGDTVTIAGEGGITLVKPVRRRSLVLTSLNPLIC